MIKRIVNYVILIMMVSVLLLSPIPLLAAEGDIEGISEYTVGDKYKVSKSIEAEYIGKDTKGREQWRAVIEAPIYSSDSSLVKIDCRWLGLVEDKYWFSSANLFSARVYKTGEVDVNNGYTTWNPQIDIKGVSDNTTTTLKIGTPALLPTDWINDNYKNNIIEIPYFDGDVKVCRRQLRLIEGVLLEYYIFDKKPNGDIVIEQNTDGDISHFARAEAWDANNKPIPLEADCGMKVVRQASLVDVAFPIVVDPSPVYYTSASDGYAVGGNNLGNYANAWTTVDLISAAGIAMELGQSLFGTSYDVSRVFVYFDTSGLPDSATITAAVLDLYGSSDYSDTNFLMTVQSGMATYPHDPLELGDYSDGNYAGDGGSQTTVGFTTAGYNSITLDATGRGWINKTGTTKLAIRSDQDIAYSAPSGDEFVYVQTYEKGVGFRPRLTVTYTAVASTVQTDAADDITGTTAMLNGQVTNDGGDTIDYYGFVWDTADQGDPGNLDPSAPPGAWANGWKSAIGDYGVAAQQHAITGLVAGTTYHVRFAAHNSVGWEYADAITFDTLDYPDALNKAESNLSSVSARLNGQVIDDGGAICEARFCWGTTSHAENCTFDGIGGASCNCTVYDDSSGWFGSYSTDDTPYYGLNSLSCNTTYYYCFQLQNSVGIECGGELSFTTDICTIGCPSHFVGVPDNDSISLTWVKGAGAANSHLRFAEDETCVSSNSTGTFLYEGALSYYTHEGLTEGTTYCYTIWGLSGNVTHGTWSSCNTTLVLTTLGAAVSDDGLPEVVEPRNWWTDSDSSGMSGFIFYDMVNGVAEATGINVNTFWLLMSILISLIVALGVWYYTKSIMVAVGGLGAMMVIGWYQGLIPGWMFGMMILITISIIGTRLRSV